MGAYVAAEEGERVGGHGYCCGGIWWRNGVEALGERGFGRERLFEVWGCGGFTPVRHPAKLFYSQKVEFSSLFVTLCRSCFPFPVGNNIKHMTRNWRACLSQKIGYCLQYANRRILQAVLA